MKSVILVGVVLGLLRVLFVSSPPPEMLFQVYKDISHIFIGGVAVAWWIDRERWTWWLFWALNAVEVATVAWKFL